ncbi:Solute carrier family 22 member 13 [Liparis tanakae]|uniref:Solute carrier family 22 member 13 n=1 Tax=Liparis tanakae TaxID=230148 RepID=A0A4Z2GA93_9TELE|nr:Solute carrier family 22 member 13 [Liparis tanakae]
MSLIPPVEGQQFAVQTATALGAISGRFGGLLAPLLNILAVYHWTIPTIVFSSLTLVSGALCLLLPETKNKDLPESADEAEVNRDVTCTNKTRCSNSESTKL